MNEKKIIYYKDELNDEFSGSNIVPRKIDKDYKYIHKNPIWNISCYLMQNVVSVPIKLGYSKLKLKTRYIGKEKLKPYKKQGYFMYGNHTQIFADTFLTSNAIYPKRNFFIVNPENVSMKFLRNSIQLLGAIPIPNEKNGMKNFIKAINKKIEKGHCVTIFPEAHIWPFYTKIRPFKAVSFRYPVDLDVPVFCMTNTYQKTGNKEDSFRLVAYIDGPFYPNKNLDVKDRRQDLRDKVYNCMVERSQNSNFKFIEYRKSGDEKIGE